MLWIANQHDGRRKAEPGAMQAFLNGSGEVRFEAKGQAEVYDWVSQTLREQGYQKLLRSGKGLVQRYISKITGLRRAQLTRLVTRYAEAGEVKRKSQRRRRFASLYTRADVELLAQVDEAHETLSGPATLKIDLSGAIQ